MTGAKEIEKKDSEIKIVGRLQVTGKGFGFVTPFAEDIKDFIRSLEERI